MPLKPENARMPDRINVPGLSWMEHFISPVPQTRAYTSMDGLSVIVGEELHYHNDVRSDGRWWLHVSVSRINRLPSWDDLAAIKDIFIGKHRRALQILPPEAEYVNLHNNCLHLWTTCEGDPLHVAKHFQASI